MKRLPVLLGLLAVTLLSTPALAETPSAQRLLDQARRNMAPVNNYSVDVQLDVKGENMTIKGMTMTLYFKRPDKTRILAKQGFSAMPRSLTLGDVLAELAKNCRPALLRTEKKQGIDCYVIRLDPIRQGSQPPALLWLDKAHLLVRATRSGGPFPVKSEWKYARVDEKYELPRRIDAEIATPRAAGFQRRDPDEPGRRGNARGAAPEPGGGMQSMRATLSFSNYRVNKGIPDSVFTSKDPPRR